MHINRYKQTNKQAHTHTHTHIHTRARVHTNMDRHVAIFSLTDSHTHSLNQERKKAGNYSLTQLINELITHTLTKLCLAVVLIFYSEGALINIFLYF